MSEFTVRMSVLSVDDAPSVTISGPQDAVLQVVAMSHGLLDRESLRIVRDIEGSHVVIGRDEYTDVERGHHGAVYAEVVS